LLAESLDTVADIVAVALLCMEAGGLVVSTTERAAGAPLYALPQPVASRANERAANNFILGCLASLVSMPV
jgi:hypothetical protein